MPKESSSPSEARQNFESVHQRTLEIFTAGDRKVMVDWLEQGDPNFGLEARVLMTGLQEHEEDFSKPIPKDLVLIAANLLSKGEGIGKPETRRGIRELLKQNIGEEELKRICFEGFEEKPTWLDQGYNFTNRGAIQTDLASKVDEAVTEFLAEREKPEAAAASAPAAPEWGDEQRAVAVEIYKSLADAERVKVDALVGSLIDSNFPDREIIAVLNGLPEAKERFDIAKGSQVALKEVIKFMPEGMLQAMAVTDNLQAVLSMRPAYHGKDETQIWKKARNNYKFYQDLPDVFRLRLEKIRPEREVAAKLAEKKQAFIQALDKMTLLASMPKPDEGLGERLESLRTTAKSEFDLGLPGKIIDEIHFEETELNEEFAKVWLRLNEGYEGGDLFIDCKTTKGEAGKVLIAMAFSKAAMPVGYEFKSLPEGIQLVRIYENAVLAVIVGRENQFTVTSEKTVDLLEAAHVVGQAYLNLQGIKEEFPFFTLGNLPNLEKLTEPEAAAATEPPKTSGSELEVAAIPAEAEEENNPGLSDWLKEMEGNVQQPAEPPGGAEPVVELQAAAPAVLPVLPAEPEAPKIIPVNSMADIARMIKEKGVGEVQFAPGLLREVVQTTFARIIAQQSSKGPRPDVVVNQFKINNGFVLSGTVSMSGFSVPFAINAGPQLNYLGHTIGGIPTIPIVFPAKARDELLQTIDRRVRAIREEISRSLGEQVEESGIVIVEGIENFHIRGQNTIVTIRGKVNR